MLRIVLTLSGCVISLATIASGLQDELRRYNALKLSEHAQLYGADNGEAAAFEGYTFTCRRQADHIPAETSVAREAFQRFVDEVKARVEPDEEDRIRRLALLKRAIAAGSWRARYFNAMWVIWLEQNSAEARAQFDQLLTMASEGNPAALHGVLRWTNGMHDDLPQRIRILKAAIERGSPQVLSTFGFDLGTRTRKQRPMGVKMLECAAAQGDGEAYLGLGRIAWLEGRWVDAYRAWQTGANLGCAGCLDAMEEIGLTRPDYAPSRGLRGQEPRVAALRAFYESQFLYSISGLIELREPAPQAMWVQWSDEQVVSVIKARIRLYGLP